MSIETVLAVLKADASVTAIVGTGTSARISPLIKSQNITLPAVTLQRTSTTPTNSLGSIPHTGLDQTRVQVDCWADSYAGARALSATCRAALQTAGHPCVGEFDAYDPETDPGVYRLTLDFSVWS
jgi:hypothetical protein